MDTPLATPQELIRPWRTATLVATLVAAIELLLLLGAAVALLAKPLSHAVRSRAQATAFAPAKKPAAKVPDATIAVGLPRLARQETGVIVLNGNGRAGAASAEAAKLHRLGYVVPHTGNAPRSDYATTLIMFRPGNKPEALRLARDLHIKAVGPLDGMPLGSLMGAHLAIVLGAG